MKTSILYISLLFCYFVTEAQQKQALVIGIDTYKATARSPFPELDGCKNDAQSMKILINAKYNFPDKNIKEVYNNQATRDNILRSINELLNECQKGDFAFVYYAGHGSQVKNSLNTADDHMDQTIVPVDYSKKNIPDIRNKELATLFDKFIDKGVILTCIFDCCHSGTIARGIQNSPPKFRYMAAGNYDAKDPSNPVPPDSRTNSNYLILSAVQADELAQEQTDENGVPHGAFTIALLTAIKQQDVNSSVNNLFTAVHAILRSNGIIQEPVMAGDVERMNGTLPGLARGALHDKILMPVESVTGNRVKIEAGMVIGLNVENELTNVNGTTKIKVTAILGPNLSEGEIIEGDKNIKPGELFEVTNWVSSSAPFLKLYIPGSKLPFDEVLQYAGIVADVKNSVHLVNDFRKNDPDISFYFNDGKWWYLDTTKGAVQLNDFATDNLLKIAARQKVNINIPPPQALSDSLKHVLLNYGNVQIVGNPNDAQYALFGTIDEDNNLAYGLVRTQLSAKDSLGMMPLQTRIFELKTGNAESYNYVTDSITEYSLRLSKVRGWLNIEPPGGGDKFPFKLELKTGNTNKVIGTEGIKVGEKFNLYVVNEKDFAAKWDGKFRYVYIFDIDQSGTMTLLYPGPSSGNTNKFPKLNENHLPILEKKLDAGLVYSGSEPVGTDNYYFLVTDEAIPDYDIVFNQAGVRGSGIEGAFGDLLNLGNATARSGSMSKTPAGWILQRIAVKTSR